MKRAILFTLFISVIVIAVCGQPKQHPARYWEAQSKGQVQCLLCPRQCVIPEGRRGFCGVRVNRGGELFTLGYNNPVAIAIDPIEKKPFFHVLPGTPALSIAVAGCNMRCLFCQNWHISQKRPDEVISYNATPEDIVALAEKYHLPSVVFTYTEPTVFYEYMLAIAKIAHQRGIRTGMHSCGYINPEPLKELLTYLDFVNIDLKSFDDDFYRELARGAALEPVLEALKMVKKSGVHLEITTLIIPGKNDSPGQVRKLCEWIRDNLGSDTPLHLSRFTPQFQLKNLPPTPVATLREAYRIARESGLKYVYIGNVIGIEEESTFCPRCGQMIIKRKGYDIIENHIRSGRCAFCGQVIEGIWSSE